MTCRFELPVLASIVAALIGCSPAADGLSAPGAALPRGPDPAAREATAAVMGDPYTIELVGNDYRWHVRYPGHLAPAASLESAPVLRDVHAPLTPTLVLLLRSLDYVYIVELPELGLKEIAVPGLEFRLEVRSDKAGQFALVGDDLCGDQHPEMQGRLIVEPRDQFLSWLNALPRADNFSGPRQ